MAKRKSLHPSKSEQKRRMIEWYVKETGELSLDADHWNASHQVLEQIEIDLDFTLDVEWRKNAPDEDEEKKAG